MKKWNKRLNDINKLLSKLDDKERKKKKKNEAERINKIL